MTITQFILIVSLFNFVLSFYVLKSNPKHPLNRSFGLCAFFIGMWVFLNYLFQSSNSIFILRAIYALAPFIILTGVLWIAYLKYKKLSNSLVHSLLLLVGVNLVFAYLMFSRSEMITSVVDYYHYETGHLFSIYSGYVLLLFLGFLVYLIFEYVKSDQYYRKQLKIITIGMFMVVIISATVGFILPAIGITKYNVLDSPSSIFFVVCGAYSIIKHELLDIKRAAVEITTYVLAILIFITLFIIEDAGFGLKFIIFLIILYFCYSLIRNIQKEYAFAKRIENLNRHLEKDKKDLMDLDRMKDEFLQMATHELNTPITVIQGKLSMAIDEDMCHLDEEQKDFLKPILNDSMRLADLSKDILNTARIDQNRLKLNVQKGNLDELITEVVEGMQSKAKDKNNTLDYVPVTRPLPEIAYDRSKISEVITNLINNANKFTSNGKILVSARTKDDSVVISVTDTGIGISPEDQKNLFKKFSQVGRFNPDNPVEQQGSGLGLFISRNIVELHGGKMWLESEENKGSAFYFSLPFEYKEIQLPNKLHIEESKLRVL